MVFKNDPSWQHLSQQNCITSLHHLLIIAFPTMVGGSVPRNTALYPGLQASPISLLTQLEPRRQSKAPVSAGASPTWNPTDQTGEGEEEYQCDVLRRKENGEMDSQKFQPVSAFLGFWGCLLKQGKEWVSIQE